MYLLHSSVLAASLFALASLSASAQNSIYFLQNGNQGGVQGSEILTINSGATETFFAYQTNSVFQSIVGDSHGNLFAATGLGNAGSSAVYQFSASGGVLSNTPTLSISIGSGFSTLAIDSSDNLYLFQINGQGVQKI